MGTSEGARRGHTPESDAKRAAAMRARFADPEYRARHAEKIRAARARQTAEERSEQARKSHSEDSDAKRAEAMQRKWEDPEYRDLRAAIEEQPETKARRSAASRATNADPRKQQQQSEMMRKLHADPAFKQLHAEGMRRANAEHPESNAARAAAMKRAWEENPEVFANSINAACGFRPTSIELALRAELDRRGIEYIAPMAVGRWALDVYVPSLSLNIEADGTYWHSAEAFPWRPEHDARRDAALKAAGITVLRLTEKEIEAGDWRKLNAVLASREGE